MSKLQEKLNELKPYNLNCNVFDVYSYDGLSMQELLCQFFTKINECITVSNTTVDLANWLVNEGLEIEVVKKLMLWLNDGTLENLINVNLFKSLNDKIDGLGSQLEHNTNEIIKIKKGSIYFDDYEPYKNNDQCNSLKLNQALTDCIKYKKDLIVNDGLYKFNDSVLVDLSSTDIKIKGNSTVNFAKIKFYYTGNSTFLTLNNGRNVYFENIEISGYISGQDTNCYKVGSIGMKIQGNIIAENSYFNGFDFIFEYGGGYYHKFISCLFAYSNSCLHNFNANNLIIDKCRCSKFYNFLSVNSGNGSVVSINSSFESFTKSIFTCLSGATPSITVNGCYIENTPKQAVPPGLIGAYSDAFVILGYSNISLIGNLISTNGIKRVVNSSTVKNIVSLSNRIEVSTDLTGDLEYYIYATNLQSAICNDYASLLMSEQTGIYTTKYISSSQLIKDAYAIYDCFKNEKYDKAYSTWINIQPLNGWEQSPIPSHSTLAYRIDGNKITLKGIIRSTNAIDDTIIILPVKPIQSVMLSTSDADYTKIKGVRVASTDGRVFSNDRSGTIILDNLSYYLD